MRVSGQRRGWFGRWRFARWWVVGAIALACLLMVWWGARAPRGTHLEGAALTMIRDATKRGASAVWIGDPGRVIDDVWFRFAAPTIDEGATGALRTRTHDAPERNNAAGQDNAAERDHAAERDSSLELREDLSRLVGTEAAKLLDRAQELVIVVDEEGVAAVQVRLSRFSAAVSKGLGILRSEPWLSGGGVVVDGKKARVVWRSATGFVANHWLLRRDDYSLGFEKAGKAEKAAPISGFSVVLSLPAAGSVGSELEGGVWGLLNDENSQRPQSPGPPRVLRWRRMAAIHQPLTAGTILLPEAVAGSIPDSVWWPVSSNEDDSVARGEPLEEEITGKGTTRQAKVPTGEQTVLSAVQRSGPGWQAIEWLDSPIEIDGLSVRIEIPRAAVLHAALVHYWKLPSETVARRLGARIIEGTTPFGFEIRFSNVQARRALERREAAAERWAMAAAENAMAGTIDLKSLSLWFEAIATMERTLPGSRNSELIQTLRQTSPVGEVLSELRPIQFYYSGNILEIRPNPDS